MVQFQKGQGGAGNKLVVDLNDIIQYDINLLDLQLILTKMNVPRTNRGQEPRVWIRYANNYYICEIGAEEIQIVLRSNINLFNPFEQDTIIGIKNFIADHQQDITLLMH